MDRSEEWTVMHEPRWNYGEQEWSRGTWIPEQIVRDFDRDKYGEVNSRLRFFLFRMPVKNVGIIIRNPKDIFLSTMNRKKNHKKMVHDIFYAFNRFLDFVATREVLVIDFSRMINDHTYVEKILRHFGINDVDINKEDLVRKVNANKKIKYSTYQSLPRRWRKEFEKHNWDILVEKIWEYGRSIE
jgi:hypothetical protein